MNLIRCDRCGKEYRGEETYLFQPTFTEDYYQDSPQAQRWDLCGSCRRGLDHVFAQADRMIRMFLSRAYVDLERHITVDWYRHLVTIAPVGESVQEKRDKEAERIRQGCAKMLTAPEYANDQICRFCGGYRVDHREGQPGPGTRYPKRS